MIVELYDSKKYKYAEYFYRQERDDAICIFEMLKEQASYQVPDGIDYDEYLEKFLNDKFGAMVDPSTGKLKPECVKRYWEYYTKLKGEGRIVDGELIFNDDGIEVDSEVSDAIHEIALEHKLEKARKELEEFRARKNMQFRVINFGKDKNDDL